MRRMVAIVAAMLVAATSGFGQNGYSLPIAEAGAPTKQDQVWVAGGISVRDNILFVGGRGTWAYIDNLLVFGDLGWADVSGWDGGPAIQAGVLYTLPLQVPADVAIRGTVYKPFIDSAVSITGATLYGIVGKDLDAMIPGLSIYGGMGLDASRSEVDYGGGGSRSEDSADVGLAAGAVFRFADTLSCFAELSYVDGTVLGAGARMEF